MIARGRGPRFLFGTAFEPSFFVEYGQAVGYLSQLANPMKTLALVASLCALGCLAAARAATPEGKDLPAYRIPNTLVRELPPSPTGRHYALYIRLPDSFGQNPERRYPAFYLCDGYWDFPMIAGAYGSLVYDKVTPEFIIVGIGYAGEGLDHGTMRNWELTPVPSTTNPSEHGHAAEFLATMEREFFPIIEGEYGGDPEWRVLGGSSHGGLFTLYAMLSRPELFQAYIAPSPNVFYEDEWIFGYEEKFANGAPSLEARLFISAAGDEWPDYVASIKRFQRRLLQSAYPGLEFQFRHIDGERHGSMKAEAYVRGLRFALEPLAPETGPLPNLIGPER